MRSGSPDRRKPRMEHQSHTMTTTARREPPDLVPALIRLAGRTTRRIVPAQLRELHLLVRAGRLPASKGRAPKRDDRVQARLILETYAGFTLPNGTIIDYISLTDLNRRIAKKINGGG